MSCERDRPTHQACRDTWLQSREGVDHVFFLGGGGSPQAADELVLNAQDDYEHVTEKSLELFKWAVTRYDYVLHCGRDTYVHVPRLLRANFQQDYVGYAGGHGDTPHFCSLDPDPQGKFSYASGGAGSWLSNRAMSIIIGSKIRHWADDLMYGWILGTYGIPLYHDPRFGFKGLQLYDSEQITVHLSQGTHNYDPEWMHRCHRWSVL